MTRELNLDRLVESWLTEGPSELPRRVIDSILADLDETKPRRLSWLPQGLTMNKTIFAIGGATALVVAALGVAYYSGPDGPGSRTPVASPGQTVRPTIQPVWTVERAAQDWPGAPRPEPYADPVVVPALGGQALCGLPRSILSSVVLGGEERCSHGPFINDPQSPERVFIDSSDERSLKSDRVLDIRAVAFREECWFKPATCVNFDTVESVERPLPHPEEEWIAFGLVADTNADGRPDFRYGIDNGADPGTGVLVPQRTQRMWRTELLTGETDVYTHALEVPSVMDASFPGDKGGPGFFGPTTGGIYAHREGELPFRFYVWASLIRNGQVVATDYAPDAGWLEAE